MRKEGRGKKGKGIRMNRPQPTSKRESGLNSGADIQPSLHSHMRKDGLISRSSRDWTQTFKAAYFPETPITQGSSLPSANAAIRRRFTNTILRKVIKNH